MALRDHFRPPLALRRHWHAFHNAWCTYLSSHLNDLLPSGYFAEPNVQFGIEVDVAAFEENAPELQLASSWNVPPPTQTVPITLASDVVEVQIYGRDGGPTLAGAIELVSPANKDRPESRDALVTKCAAYLQAGIGLAIVDVVTDRRARLDEELLVRLHEAPGVHLTADLYAAAFRPVERDEQPSVDIWQLPLSVGRPLGTLPLWLRGGICLRVDLDATYERTCREQRIETSVA